MVLISGSLPKTAFFQETVEGTDTVMVLSSQAPIVSSSSEDSKAKDKGKAVRQSSKVVEALVKGLVHPSIVMEEVVTPLANSKTLVKLSKELLSPLVLKVKVRSAKVA